MRLVELLTRREAWTRKDREQTKQFTFREYLEAVRVDFSKGRLRALTRSEYDLLMEMAALSNLIVGYWQDRTAVPDEVMRRLMAVTWNYKLAQDKYHPQYIDRPTIQDEHPDQTFEQWKNRRRKIQCPYCKVQAMSHDQMVKHIDLRHRTNTPPSSIARETIIGDFPDADPGKLEEDAAAIRSSRSTRSRPVRTRPKRSASR